MKAFILVLIGIMAGITGTACNAGTFFPLATPDNAVAYPGFPSSHGCGGETFNPTDTAHGYCYRSKSTACSGRGCQPTVYTDYFDVNWNVDGSVLSSALCGTRKHHNPQADVFAYSFGYDATNCRGPALSSDTTVFIDPYNYYYFATSDSGLYELVRGGTVGPAIYQF